MNETIKKIQVDGVDYDIQAKELTKVTYAELKEMRDNGSLSAGHLYRITDYEFTTVQAGTKSAGNVFDIIVLAVAENQLSELARAIAHEGDTYFDGNNLSAWELWYDLDNDTNKYEWADAENGKGVIYRMIDEKRNDCPYDFKNALFYNIKLITGIAPDMYYYTFSYVVERVLYDGTVEKEVKQCRDNSMGVYRKSNKKYLNLNVFRNIAFEDNCHSNTFGYNCYSNTFGNSCHSNTFGYNCHSNTFGYYCHSNTFGNYCHSNTFGNSCHSNTFGNSCYYNTFGYNCYYNTFGYNCYYNTFGNSCHSNTFGNSCHSNTFGDSVSNREAHGGKISITLNDEYYDDGSGQLVPIKHPDLSTQPSILPYKFMGQYVYEQLIPIPLDIDNLVGSGGGEREIPIEGFDPIPTNLFSLPNIGILEANLVLFNYGNTQEGYPKVSIPTYWPVSISARHLYGEVVAFTLVSGPIPSYLGRGHLKTVGVYLRVVYTSMPEEGDYYGYNSY